MLRAFRPDFRIGATDIDEGRTRRKLRAITGDRYEARRISGILLDERRHLERPTPRDAETELGCRGIDKPQFRRDDAAGVRIILPAQSGGEGGAMGEAEIRSEEHTSELQSLMRNSYAVFCLKKKKRIENI